MRAALNFGHVIDYYIAIIFPSSKVEQVATGENEAQKDDKPREGLDLHAALYALQLLVLIVLLISLSFFVLHVRSSYTTTATLKKALKAPVAVNEQGFAGLCRRLDVIRRNKDPDLKLDETHIASVIHKHHELQLDGKTAIVGYENIRNMQDVAFWLQFGLIPAMFKGLSSYNKLVAGTVRLSYQRTDYSDIRYHNDRRKEAPNVFFTPLLAASMAGVEVDDPGMDNDDQRISDDIDAQDGEAHDVVKVISNRRGNTTPQNTSNMKEYLVRLPYASDGKYHTYSRSGGNYQYVTGKTVDEALASLNLGMNYIKAQPYFPLAAVITNETTSSVYLEAFVSNAHSYTVSYVNVGFVFGRGPTGEKEYITKSVNASSISSSRDGRAKQVNLVIYILLICVTVAHLLHSLFRFRKQRVYATTTLYVVDLVSKGCLVLCIVAYGVRLFWSDDRLPHIHSTVLNESEYESVVGLSNDPRAIDADRLQAVFNSLRQNILRGYWSVGLFQIVIFATVFLLFVMLCITLCQRTRIGLMLSYFAFHSLFQLTFGIFVVLLALCVLSLVNAYIVNYVYSDDSSFRYNLATLSNILAGAYNKQVGAYLQNQNVLHSIVAVLLLVLFSYAGIFVLITMMFSNNFGNTIESFETRPPRDPYDNSRLIKLVTSTNSVLRRFFATYNVGVLRRYAMSGESSSELTEKEPPMVETGRFEGLGHSSSSFPATGSQAWCPDKKARSNRGDTSNVRIKLPLGPSRCLPNQMPVDPPSNGEENGPQSRSTGFTCYNVLRFATYSLVTAGVLAFAIKEQGYHSVRMVIENAIKGSLSTTEVTLPVTFKEFTIKDALGNNATVKPPAAPPVQPHQPTATVATAVAASSVVPRENGEGDPKVNDPPQMDPSTAASQAEDDSGDSTVLKQPTDIRAIVTRASLSPQDIASRQQLYQWLAEGEINKLFQLQDFQDDFLDPEGLHQRYLSIHNRYMLVPASGPILVEIMLRTKEGLRLPIFGRMVHDVDALATRSIIEPIKESFRFRELFGEGQTDFPDVVKSVKLDMLFVDPRANNKLYRASIMFLFRNSGVIVPTLKVRSAFGVHFSSTYSNWGFVLVSTASCLSFLVFLSFFSVRLYKFVREYNRIYRILWLKDRWKGVAVYFLNDYFRLLDLIVLLSIGTMCGYYMGINVHTGTIYRNALNLSSLEARLELNHALDNLRFYHMSLWATLTSLVFMVLFREVPLFQRLTSMIYICVRSALTLYLLVTIAMFLVVAILLFFLLIFASEHFMEFSRGDGSLLNAIKVLFNESTLSTHIYESRPIALLIYPACIVLKLWILNIILCYMWSIWPKEDKKPQEAALDRNPELFSPQGLEPYCPSVDEVHVTSISEEQLDWIDDDLKLLSTNEAMRFNELFKDYNRQYTESGMSALSFIEWLHANLATEMHEMLANCEAMQQRMDIVEKQLEIMETRTDRNLEANISLLEVALADKREELAAVFAEYKAAVGER